MTHLDIRCQQQSASGRGAEVDLRVQSLELLDRTASVVVCDQMAELAQYVSCDLDKSFVHRSRLQMLKYCPRGICLQVLVVRNKLNHSVPYLGSHVIACCRDKLENGIDIPLVL